MRLVDSHSHIDVAEFAHDRDTVLTRARAVGVTRQIVPAIEFATWESLRALCAREDGLHPAYGLHPMLLHAHRDAHLDALGAWLERERPVAVGECGLDYFVEGLDRERQRIVFRRQLELARELALPVVLHARRAVDDVLAMVRDAGVRGVVHSFSGSAEQARQAFKLGLSLGIGGPVTYARATRLRGIVAAMPIEHLLLETDSPDQPLHGHPGERNEPARLTEVLDVVAQLRGVDREEIARATTANAIALFRLL